MMYLCPMEDEGLTILPPHRLVRCPDEAQLSDMLAGLDSYFAIAYPKIVSGLVLNVLDEIS